MALIPTDINGEQILAFDGNGDFLTQLAADTGRRVGQKAVGPDGSEYKLYAGGWIQTSFGGAVWVLDKGFVPSSYDTSLTMDGTAQGVPLASGARKVQFVNLGATTEAIRVAFGTSELDAEGNLNISAGAATTGYYIPAAAEGESVRVLGVPTLATHYAVANAVASDTQVVAITQGI